MRSIAALVIAVVASLPTLAASPAFPASPQALYPGLFEQVAEAHLFDDSKRFADASPRVSPERVMADYASAKPSGVEALRAFVVPGNEAQELKSRYDRAEGQAPAPLARHIDGLWDALTRRSPAPVTGDSLLCRSPSWC